MQFAPRSAAHNAASQAESWVELALQASAGDGAERVVVKFILDDDDAGSMVPGEASLCLTAQVEAVRLPNLLGDIAR